jgi:hypothetical protein
VINAHKLFKSLRDAGMDERQADAFAAAIDDFMREDIATKGDVAAVRADITLAVEQVKSHTWQTCLTVCGAVGVIQIGVIYALIERLIAR